MGEERPQGSGGGGALEGSCLRASVMGLEVGQALSQEWPPPHPLLPWPVSEAIVQGTFCDDPRLRTMPDGEGCLRLSGFQLGTEALAVRSIW